MNKYKIIAFDLDDTLIDNEKSMKYAFTVLLNFLSISYSETLVQQWLRFDSQFWCDWHDKKFAIPQNISNLVEYCRSLRFYLFFKNIPISFETAIYLNTLYCNALGNCIEEIPGAYRTVKNLSSAYKIVIAINGVQNLIHQKLQTIHISSFISYVICSEVVGENKPSPLFFNYLLQHCNCTNNDVLFVGDSLTSDILGGMINHIDTCWFNPKNQTLPKEYTPTCEIQNLYELTRKLLP